MPIVVHLCHTGARKVSAIVSDNALANIFIITIEHKSEIFVKKVIVGLVRFQNEFLKKPSGVAEVPFWRRHINNWLNHIILNFQWFANIFGMLAGFEKERNQSINSDHKKSVAPD